MESIIYDLVGESARMRMHCTCIILFAAALGGQQTFFLYTHVYIHIYTHTHAHTHARAHTHTLIYIYIYIYIYTHTVFKCSCLGSNNLGLGSCYKIKQHFIGG
jgi:hypothetical protein